MKTHAIVVMQGFAVVVPFRYNIVYSKTLEQRFGKLLVVKNARERTSHHYGSLGAKLPAPGQFLQFFGKNGHFNRIWLTFSMFTEQLKKAKLQRFGRV